MDMALWACSVVVVLVVVIYYGSRNRKPFGWGSNTHSHGGEDYIVHPTPFPHQLNLNGAASTGSYSQSNWIAPGAYGVYHSKQNKRQVNDSHGFFSNFYFQRAMSQQNQQAISNFGHSPLVHSIDIRPPDRSANVAVKENIQKLPSEKQPLASLNQVNKFQEIASISYKGKGMCEKEKSSTTEAFSARFDTANCATKSKFKQKESNSEPNNLTNSSESITKTQMISESLPKLTQEENLAINSATVQEQKVMVQSFQATSVNLNHYDQRKSINPITNEGTSRTNRENYIEAIGNEYIHDELKKEHGEDVMETLPKYTSGNGLNFNREQRISLKQDNSYIGRLNPDYRPPQTVSPRNN
ncbi:expressed protein [Phakopsora pachyrhizi]|uniref:Expressed protein n=1 Tax=Phakopsora pachyrhizi TaxID=170000 RepID=A0AAV0AGN4_PHAPC|nr:expressed protein [Phakopsora pachyrhizi]